MSLERELGRLSEVFSLLMTSVCYQEFVTKFSTCRMGFLYHGGDAERFACRVLRSSSKLGQRVRDHPKFIQSELL